MVHSIYFRFSYCLLDGIRYSKSSQSASWIYELGYNMQPANQENKFFTVSAPVQSFQSK